MKDLLKLLGILAFIVWIVALPFIQWGAIVYVAVHFIHKLW